MAGKNRGNLRWFFSSFLIYGATAQNYGGTPGDATETSKCFGALQRYPKPDVTYTAKHLYDNCPELCRNSSGRFPTGQFPHPWDCNAFINCYQDDAWVHWCQVGLVFNEKNLECDWPRNVDCDRSQPAQFTQAPGATTTSQWELIATPSSRLVNLDVNVVTCKDSVSKLNDKEYIGVRPDLCLSGSGDYPAPDCRFYVRCVGLVAYVSRCPGGFLFNAADKRCDWPNKSPKCLKTCIDNGNYVSEDPETTPVPKPLRTTLATTTVDPSLVNATCNESHCIPKKGCQPELCREARGQFPVPGQCRSFANCWDFCAYITECPPRMVFSESKTRCDLPWNIPKSDKCYQTAEISSALQMVQTQGDVAGGFMSQGTESGDMIQLIS